MIFIDFNIFKKWIRNMRINDLKKKGLFSKNIFSLKVQKLKPTETAGIFPFHADETNLQSWKSSIRFISITFSLTLMLLPLSSSNVFTFTGRVQHYKRLLLLFMLSPYNQHFAIGHSWNKLLDFSLFKKLSLAVCISSPPKSCKMTTHGLLQHKIMINDTCK